MKDYIGVVDSGVGGLDILNYLKADLKHENFIFIADNMHVPYGAKSKEQLEQYGIEIAQYLERNGVKMIIIACNTLSLNAIDKMRESVSIPIYGIARPTVKGFLNHDLKSVLLLATQATINSNRYVEFIKEIDDSIIVYSQAAPKLVDYIESNNLANINDALIEYIDSYASKVEAIILGCTHYPIIKDRIKKLYPNLTLFDSRKQMVQLTNEKLDYHNIRSSNEKQEIIIQATGSIKALREASQLFFDFNGYQTIEGGVNNE
ncbi:glutamate racemase [Erysipelotrichaceae bacterium OttesenSCG-928-M19]|nr:glutamate racemase [Erysipelotrichaceae bacterium OttesenSCG-928-M19]